MELLFGYGSQIGFRIHRARKLSAIFCQGKSECVIEQPLTCLRKSKYIHIMYDHFAEQFRHTCFQLYDQVQVQSVWKQNDDLKVMKLWLSVAVVFISPTWTNDYVAELVCLSMYLYRIGMIMERIVVGSTMFYICLCWLTIAIKCAPAHVSVKMIETN